MRLATMALAVLFTSISAQADFQCALKISRVPTASDPAPLELFLDWVDFDNSGTVHLLSDLQLGHSYFRGHDHRLWSTFEYRPYLTESKDQIAFLYTYNSDGDPGSSKAKVKLIRLSSFFGGSPSGPKTIVEVDGLRLAITCKGVQDGASTRRADDCSTSGSYAPISKNNFEEWP